MKPLTLKFKACIKSLNVSQWSKHVAWLQVWCIEHLVFKGFRVGLFALSFNNKGASVLKWQITLLIQVLTTSPQSNSFYRLVFSLHIFQTSTKLSDFAVLSECLADCQTAFPYHVYISFPQHIHSQLNLWSDSSYTWGQKSQHKALRVLCESP